MSLDQLFTVAEYTRCLHAAQTRYGWMLRDTGFTAREVVHELYIRLSRKTTGWDTRRHFRATCDLALRHIVIDLRRSKHGIRILESLDESTVARGEGYTSPELQFEVEDALSLLQARRPRQYSVVCHRFLRGQSVAETARLVGVSDRTVKRDTVSAAREFRLIWETR